LDIINLCDQVKRKASSFAMIDMVTLSVGLRKDESDTTQTLITHSGNRSGHHNTENKSVFYEGIIYI